MTDTVREALRRLVAEVGGLAAFKRETREAIGHTNWAVLQLRRAEAEHALREDRGTAALREAQKDAEPIAYLRPAMRGSLGWETCPPNATGAFPVYDAARKVGTE
jgi:hypothetical protein